MINAKATRSQLVGSLIFGIGHALLEADALQAANGRPAGATLADSLVPVNADVPPVEVHRLDHPDTTFSTFAPGCR